jgi:hypothetical protein
VERRCENRKDCHDIDPTPEMRVAIHFNIKAKVFANKTEEARGDPATKPGKNETETS